MLKELFTQQRDALNHFFQNLNLLDAESVLKKIKECKGSLFFSGVGKSGLIAEKLASTFISIGIKAFYLPPTNALHGDLGVIGPEDLVVFLSKSGETKELISLAPFIKKKQVSTMAWVCEKKSLLSQICDSFIFLPLLKELCPFNLVPTNSATIQLVFGDLLCVALMKEKEFTLEDYALNHPAGSIGRKITLKVADLMLQGPDLPTCYLSDCLKNVLSTLSEKKCGCVVILDNQQLVKGIFTDGDLRRSLQKNSAELFDIKMENLMVKDFLSINKESLLNEAFLKMQNNSSKKITTLPVLEEGKLLGLIRLHDLLNV